VLWPTEPGCYWFYGQAFGSDKTELHFVQVFKTKNNLAFVGSGHFMFKGDSFGMWQAVDLPELPKDGSNE
jgi:hypothetical protein